MGCPELTERDYYRLQNCTEKTAYSRFFYTVTDDPIGNRTAYDTTESGSPVTSLYTTNNLNQYTQISKGNPPVVALPTHDNDGNMLTMALASGEWSATYNGENRLVIAESATQRLEFSYDYMGRRVEKKVYSGTPGSWTLDEHSRFVYDGYLQIEKLDALNSNAVVRKRIWSDGKVICDIHGSTPYYALGDANKNLTEYLGATGAVAAHFEYSPFGKITVASGSDPDDFDFRFSSEVFEHETGLVYYNYRYYSPEMGRWLSRDPIGEHGGWNLYGIVSNGAINGNDYLGRESCSERGGELKNNKCCCKDKAMDPNSNCCYKETILNETGDFSTGYRICSRTVRYDPETDPSMGRFIYPFFIHCDLRKDPCDAGDKEYPVSKRSTGTLDGGKPCACATKEDIDACLTKNSYDAGNGTWGNNCQSNTTSRVNKCCLKTSWDPSCYAGNYRGRCLKWESYDPTQPGGLSGHHGSDLRCVKWEHDFWE